PVEDRSSLVVNVFVVRHQPRGVTVERPTVVGVVVEGDLGQDRQLVVVQVLAPGVVPVDDAVVGEVIGVHPFPQGHVVNRVDQCSIARSGAGAVDGGGDVLGVGGDEGPRGGRPHRVARHVNAVRVHLALGDPAVDDVLDGGHVGLET